ncbi:UDP-N-acetylmuramoyl-tripeptide--D-alanyl-D-alanine ligase [Azospira restricta]|uniref:UDP-N-acetylmuramoyl-tripeptide--D-alanyl-D-alanine ligase n=1 Tax=Azospira restricta TaxID=404405 RepID=A0A974SSX7_9RHOO|nr:UDP-N-acetylmuramoyl-tripeptide--D-alanyl-D-alanine ligase [Azospira restricta]QRJ65804.1 UDP-N-acetylmuramoyl-tripeptide--D-alanyl-D-alanine ligase [Azospira restricta]
MLKLSAAAAALNGRLIGADAGFYAVSTDSRAIRAGDLFVALRGERFDGHDFIGTVASEGAVGAVVAADAAEALKDVGLPLIAVADTRLALGALAAHWRAGFDLPLIAVTGSNGKTTTKEMIACILQAAFGGDVLATQGNLNNDIGLPLTLLQLRAHHQAAIVEMGMNHPGEIGYLTRLARPTVALVTNAQRAHLQGMGTLDAIAREKGTIYDGLAADGVAVINADDPHAPLWQAMNVGRRVISFGLDGAADVHGRVRLHGLETELHFITPAGEGAVDLALPGAHNARNALAAVAATFAAGVPLAAIAAGLAAFKGVKGRLQRRAGANGAVILDDTYNANPDSMRAGIDVLASTIGRKILVLGDMGEIGDAAAQYHDEVGGYAKSAGVDALYALGEASAIAARNFGDGAHHYKKIEDLIEALKPELTANTTVLVKGSRFMRMERVADAIALPTENPPCS